MKILMIGMGGFFGTVVRHWLSLLISEKVGPSFPWGTLAVNVIGSLFIGFIATVAFGSRALPSQDTRDFLMIGILGGFTTFSSFSLQTLLLMQNNHWGLAAGNILLSLGCCLAAVWIGSLLGRFVS